jgi:hypothetical protein
MVWSPDQIQTFLMSVRRDRFAPLFLLELTTRDSTGPDLWP